MAFLRLLLTIFLLPGTMVLNAFGISPEQDGGIFRSLINMIFWGLLSFLVALPFLVASV